MKLWVTIKAFTVIYISISIKLLWLFLEIKRLDITLHKETDTFSEAFINSTNLLALNTIGNLKKPKTTFSNQSNKPNW